MALTDWIPEIPDTQMPDIYQSVAERMYRNAQAVMEYLGEHGGAIVPHLLDTDDNPGECLRVALRDFAAIRNDPACRV